MDLKKRTMIEDKRGWSFVQITIPSSHTYYHCSVMKLPTLKEKHHVFKVKVVLRTTSGFCIVVLDTKLLLFSSLFFFVFLDTVSV